MNRSTRRTGVGNVEGAGSRQHRKLPSTPDVRGRSRHVAHQRSIDSHDRPGVVVIAEWVFRHAGGCIIDQPDLPTPTAGFAWRWIATFWPDPLTRTGWGAVTWDPAVRGFVVPGNLAVGDVIEFGIAANDPAGNAVPGVTRHWYGWLDHISDRALIVHGPFDSPAAAHQAARPAIDLVRMNELTGPTPTTLDPEWIA
jgi:hypothetical protein